MTATLGRECRDWAEGETDRAVEAIIAEQSREGDAVIFTDGSVQRGVKSGWAYTVRVNGETVVEGSGAVDITTSSMLMEVKTITEALRYLQTNHLKREIIVTDSMSTLQNQQRVSLCRLGNHHFQQQHWTPVMDFQSRRCNGQRTGGQSNRGGGHRQQYHHRPTYCGSVCHRSAHRKQTSIVLVQPLSPERKGGSARRWSHLQPQGCGSPSPEPAPDGNLKPPDTTSVTDDEG